MKVMFLSNAASIHIVRWANAMAKRNFDVYVVSCKNHVEKVNKYVEGVKIIKLKYNSGIGYYLNKRCLRKVIKEISPDIINVHYASGYGTLARKAKIKKYLLNVWGSDIYDFPQKSMSKKRLIIKNLKKATRIASTSRAMAIETKKYTDKNIDITPFGVDTEIFKEKAVSNGDKFVFCTVKTLAPKYGIVGLIEAFSLFMKKLAVVDENLCQNVEYRIYGTGEQKEEIEKLIADLNLQKNVFLMGYVENNLVPDAINACDIFILKSELDSESFGVAAVEAMACSKPVIVSDVAGFCEVIENGKSGIVVYRYDVAGFAECMFELYFDKDKRHMLGTNARARVEELYDWRKNVDIMISIYKEIIKA